MSQIFSQLTVYIVVNVEFGQLNRYVYDQAGLGHLYNGTHRTLGLAVYAGNLRGEFVLNHTVAGNYKVERDLLSHREVEICICAVLESTGYGLTGINIGDYKGQTRLGGNHEIGEVGCFKPYIANAFFSGLGFAIHLFTNAILNGTNANRLLDRVEICICVGNANFNRRCKVLGKGLAVYQKVKYVEICVIQLCVGGIREGVGRFGCDIVGELYHTSCVSVELCKGSILKLEEVIRVLLASYRQGNVGEGIDFRTLEDVCIVHIQHEPCGNIVNDVNNVRTVVLSDVIIHANVKAQEVVGNRFTVNNNVVLNSGISKYTLSVFAVVPTYRVVLKEHAIALFIRKVERCINGGKQLCIIAKRIALFHHDGTDNLAIVTEGNLY